MRKNDLLWLPLQPKFTKQFTMHSLEFSLLFPNMELEMRQTFKKLHAFSVKNDHASLWEITCSDYLTEYHKAGSEIHPPWVWHLQPLTSEWGLGIQWYWTLSYQADGESFGRWTLCIPYLSELFGSSSPVKRASIQTKYSLILTLYVHLFLGKSKLSLLSLSW